MNYQELLESLKNYSGVQDWKVKKQEQDMFNGDVNAIEFLDKISGLGVGDMAGVGAIKAWHGTPHLFKHKDYSYMGAGEGRQAFGWGGYSGELPKTGRGYRKTTSLPENIRELPKEERDSIQGLRDYLAQQKSVEREVLKYSRRADRTEGPMHDYYLQQAEKRKESLNNQPPWQELVANYFDPNTVEKMFSSTDMYHGGLENFTKSFPRPGPRRGYLYELSHEWPDKVREAENPLNAYEHLLQWNDPLILQPDHVYDSLLNSSHYDDLPDGMTGEDFYNKLIRELGSDKAASQELYKLGIPGHQFPDGWSRGKEDMPSHNYVIYDDKVPNVKSIEGVPVDEIDWTDPRAFFEQRKLGRVR